MKAKKEHDQMCVYRSISMPRYIDEILGQQQNASAVVTHILEENLDKISDGKIDKLLRSREKDIKDLAKPAFKQALEEVMDEVFEKYSFAIKKDK